jgi:hypothetical protein
VTPFGLEGSALFDALNVGQRSVTLNLKGCGSFATTRLVTHFTRLR